jgi:hypothetical protein
MMATIVFISFFISFSFLKHPCTASGSCLTGTRAITVITRSFLDRILTLPNPYPGETLSDRALAMFDISSVKGPHWLSLPLVYIHKRLTAVCSPIYNRRKIGAVLQMEQLKSHIYDFLFLISVFSVLCLLCWKCRFGFGNVDEAFYLTIPWRLTQGDALFLEEWHLSQMSGFLLLPLVAIFRAFDSTAEGIILVFRYICITVQTLCCVWYYHRLKRISPAGAFAASILALIFIPFNITALSYNSMGIFLMGLSTVTLATLRGTPSARIDLLFSGVTFAGAVLC